MGKLDGIVRRYMPLSAVIDTLQRREIALLDPQNWDDRNDRKCLQIYKERKGYRSLYAMCAADCSETYSHWRIYTPGADGACVELVTEHLEEALRTRGDALFRSVDYVTLPEVDRLSEGDLDRLPFCKRAGYGAEEEYRVIAWSDKDQAAALSMPIEVNWIRRVELNPWMPPPLAESMKKTLKLIPEWSHLRVSQSTLIDNKRWRDAADRVGGRIPPEDLTK